MASELEIGKAARAIEYLGPQATAELLGAKTTEAQWAAIFSWLESKRKEVKNARLQTQITQMQGEIEA